MKKITTPNGKILFLNMGNLHSADAYLAKSGKFWINLKFNNGLIENIGEFENQIDVEKFINASI